MKTQKNKRILTFLLAFIMVFGNFTSTIYALGENVVPIENPEIEEIVKTDNITESVADESEVEKTQEPEIEEVPEIVIDENEANKEIIIKNEFENKFYEKIRRENYLELDKRLDLFEEIDDNGVFNFETIERDGMVEFRTVSIGNIDMFSYRSMSFNNLDKSTRGIDYSQYLTEVHVNLILKPDSFPIDQILPEGFILTVRSYDGAGNTIETRTAEVTGPGEIVFTEKMRVYDDNGEKYNFGLSVPSDVNYHPIIEQIIGSGNYSDGSKIFTMNLILNQLISSEMTSKWITSKSVDERPQLIGIFDDLSGDYKFNLKKDDSSTILRNDNGDQRKIPVDELKLPNNVDSSNYQLSVEGASDGKVDGLYGTKYFVETSYDYITGGLFTFTQVMNITLDPNGGTVNPGVLEVPYGQVAVLPTPTPPSGKEFVQWKNGDIPYDTTQPVTTDLNLVAGYKDSNPDVIVDPTEPTPDGYVRITFDATEDGNINGNRYKLFDVRNTLTWSEAKEKGLVVPTPVYNDSTKVFDKWDKSFPADTDTVTEVIYMAEYKNATPDVIVDPTDPTPDGYVRITFDATEDGNINGNRYKLFDVRNTLTWGKAKEKGLVVPTPNYKDNTKMFTTWEPTLPEDSLTVMEETFTAQYSDKTVALHFKPGIGKEVCGAGTYYDGLDQMPDEEKTWWLQTSIVMKNDATGAEYVATHKGGNSSSLTIEGPFKKGDKFTVTVSNFPTKYYLAAYQKNELTISYDFDGFMPFKVEIKENPQANEVVNLHFLMGQLLFDPNGGQWSDNTTESITKPIKSDNTVDFPENPTREGYDFQGWFYKFGNNPEREATPNRKYNVCLNLKAKWLENIIPVDPDNPDNPDPDKYVKITLDPNGGTFANDAVREYWVLKTYIVKPADFEEKSTSKLTASEEKVFKEWSEDVVGSKPLATEGKQFATNTTLYAQYEEDPDIIEGTDPDSPIPEGYTRVIFKKGDHGTLTSTFAGSTLTDQDVLVYDVKKDLKFSVVPIPKVVSESGWTFGNWAPELQKADEVVKAETYIAQYKRNVIPVNPEDPETPEGYVLVKFEKGLHGELVGNTAFNVLKGTAFSEVKTVMPTVTPEDGWAHVGWEPELPADTAKVEVDATYTAQYSEDPDIIEGTDPDSPVPEGYTRVIFKKGDHGKLTSTFAGSTLTDQDVLVYDVKKDLKFSVVPIPKVVSESGWTFGNWAPELQKADEVVKAETYIAQYKRNVIPVNPEDPQTPEGYVLVKFEKGLHGELVGNTAFNVLKGTAFSEVKAVMPTVTPEDGWAHVGWEPELPADTAKVEADATYTAQYKKDSTEEGPIVIEGTDPDSPIPKGYTRVIFRKGSNCTLTSTFEGSTLTRQAVLVYDVKDGYPFSVVPIPRVVSDSGYRFKAWNPNLQPRNEIVVARTYTATYELSDNVIPVDPTDPVTPGYVRIIFLPGDYGSLLGHTVFDVRIGTPFREVREKMPEVVPIKGYYHSGWNPNLPSDNTLVRTGATYTAQYRKYSDGEYLPWIPIWDYDYIWRPSHTTTVTKPELNKDDHFAYIKGYPDGTFRAESQITRGEVAVIFARLVKGGINGIEAGETRFTDVKRSDWYHDSIAYLARHRIIEGYPDGTFRPEKEITRAEFAAIVTRFSSVSGGSSNFTDVSINHWAKKYIDFAYSKGWIVGYPDGTFRPERNITRAEAVTIVNKVLNRSADKDYIQRNIALIKTFRDLTDVHWAYYDVLEAANSHDYIRNANGSETWIRVRN